MKTPITPARLREHLSYSWWKYLLAAAGCCLLWNLVFAVTAPQVPEDRKLDVYFYAYGNAEAAQAWFDGVREKEFPDQKISVEFILPDDAYGSMALTARVFAGEGDLMILPRSVFQTYSGEGLFIPLEEMPDIPAACEAAGVNLERGWRMNTDEGVRHLYGIPLAGLDTLRSWIAADSDCYLSIRVRNGNDENAAALLRTILREMLPALIPGEQITLPD